MKNKDRLLKYLQVISGTTFIVIMLTTNLVLIPLIIASFCLTLLLVDIKRAWDVVKKHENI